MAQIVSLAGTRVIPCPSGKVQFASKIEALICLVKHQRKKPDGKPKPERVYECDLCGFWHLTKQPKRGIYNGFE